jgi:hypothetical protein
MSPWLLQVNFSIFVIVSLSLTYSVPWWSYKLKAGVEESSSWLKSYVWFSRLNHKQVQRIFYLAGSLGKLSFPHHTWCTATPLQSLKGVGVKDLELLPVHTLFFFSYLHFKPRAFIVNLYIHICLRSAVSLLMPLMEAERERLETLYLALMRSRALPFFLLSPPVSSIHETAATLCLVKTVFYLHQFYWPWTSAPEPWRKMEHMEEKGVGTVSCFGFLLEI